MKPTPQGWPRISSSIYYRDASHAIDWLCEAFGFEVRLKVEGDAGQIEHSELTFGDGMIMVGQAGAKNKPLHRQEPNALAGANTQAVMVFVDDVDAHYARALAAGVNMVREPTIQDYGPDYWTDRSYECVDIGGHHWWFCQRLRSANP